MSTLARIMWDSTTPATSIPKTAAMVAGYANGDFAWTADDWALFPDAVKLRISVKGLIPCDAYDIEKGDYLPSDAPSLIQEARGAGIVRPCLYFSRDTYAEVRQYVDIPGANWCWWCADWTGSPHPVVMSDGGTASAVQYANPQYTGANYDLSAVYDDSFPIPQAPIPEGVHVFTYVPGSEAPGGAPSVFYESDDGHIQQLYYAPADGGNWHHGDLTAATGAPPARA